MIERLGHAIFKAAETLDTPETYALLETLKKLHTTEGDTIWYDENTTLDEVIERIENENPN